MARYGWVVLVARYSLAVAGWGNGGANAGPRVGRGWAESTLRESAW